jgi:hypothetical protein
VIAASSPASDVAEQYLSLDNCTARLDLLRDRVPRPATEYLRWILVKTRAAHLARAPPLASTAQSPTGWRAVLRIMHRGRTPCSWPRPAARVPSAASRRCGPRRRARHRLTTACPLPDSPTKLTPSTHFTLTSMPVPRHKRDCPASAPLKGDARVRHPRFLSPTGPDGLSECGQAPRPYCNVRIRLCQYHKPFASADPPPRSRIGFHPFSSSGGMLRARPHKAAPFSSARI